MDPREILQEVSERTTERALIAQMDEDSRRAKVTLAWEQWDSAWPASPLMALGTETRGA